MKRFIFALIMAVMILGACLSVSAEEMSDELKSVIIAVKEKINIPDEYSEFDYSYDNVNGYKRYSLEWVKKEKSEENGTYIYNPEIIKIITDEKGSIIYYAVSKNYEEVSISKQKTKQECIKAAEDFIKMIMPDTYSEYKYDKNDYIDSSMCIFKRYKNNVSVEFNDIVVIVNKQNLDIIGFGLMNSEYFDSVFDKTDEVINKDKAIDYYLDYADYKPKYQFSYDFYTKEKKVFLAYGKSDFGNRAVDAKTGDIIDISFGEKIDRDSYGYNKEMMEEVDAGAGDSERLSEEEIKKIEAAGNLISKETALEEIKKAVPENIKFKDAEYTSLSKNLMEDGDEYIWNISFENGYASINAKTKEIISFYSYDEYDIGTEEEEMISEKRQTAARELIKKLAAEKADKVELSEKSSSNYELVFVRKVNGYEFPANNISIIFDKNDKIVSYSCSWYKSVKFPDDGKLIDRKEAFSKIRNSGGFDLGYNISDENQEKKVVLTYCLKDIEKISPYIDAKTGKELDYNGSEYKSEVDAFESYPDIVGHWCEKFVNSLRENNIYIKRKMFMPDEKITKKELLNYYATGFSDEIRKIYTNNNEFITRREMCGVISYTLDYKMLTDKENLFKNVFTDVEETDEGFGDMAAANAMGIITADKDGKFYPDREITNAEAAKIIYALEDLRYS